MGSTSTASGSGTVSTWTGELIVAGGAIAVLATGKLLQCVLYRTGQTSTAGGVGVVPLAGFFLFLFVNFVVSKGLAKFSKILAIVFWFTLKSQNFQNFLKTAFVATVQKFAKKKKNDTPNRNCEGLKFSCKFVWEDPSLR
jgi:hypothetical protein